MDNVGRGRDDSETFGRRLSGPYGGRDSVSRIPGKIRDSHVKPRAPAGGASSSSSLRLRFPRFLRGGFGHSDLAHLSHTEGA